MLRNFFLNMEPPLDPPLKRALLGDAGESVYQFMLIIAQTSNLLPDNFNTKFIHRHCEPLLFSAKQSHIV